jgi:protocatechuate 3,4-dioxygenase beta subunit
MATVDVRHFSRRALLRGGAGALAAIAADAPVLGATPEVDETEDNQEGPFYKAGAPIRDSFIEKGTRGTRLLLTGKVLDLKGRPLEGAELDLWQASADGEYDNQGFTLRGRVMTGRGGVYRVETIVPKFYQAGSNIRPAHIHVKAHKSDGPVLTTQLYFRGDPYNYADGSVRPSLVMDLQDNGGNGRRAEFDFVIRTR